MLVEICSGTQVRFQGSGAVSVLAQKMHKHEKYHSIFSDWFQILIIHGNEKTLIVYEIKKGRDIVNEK